VTVRARDEYFPLIFLSPLGIYGSRPPIGFDLATDRGRADAMRKARRTGQLALTQRFRFLHQRDDYGIMALRPVYRPESDPTGQKVLLGFVAGVFRVSDVFEAAVSGLASQGIDMYVFDKSAPPGDRFLHYYRAPGSTARPISEEELRRLKGISFLKTVPLGGRTWLLVAVPTPHLLATRRQWLPWVALFTLLYVTAMLVYYIWSTLRRAEIIQDAVRAGTAELLKANRELEAVIQERRRAEDELRQTNAFLDSIIENIPDMVFLKDAINLRFVRFNKAAEKIVGYSRDHILGKSDFDFFPPEEAEFFIRKDREVLAAGKLVEIPEEPIHTANGIRYLHTKKMPILDTAGNPVYLLGISEDITSRKRSEERLREMSIAMENAVEGISKVDGAGRFIQVNKAYADLLGYDAAEMSGMELEKTIYFPDREKLQEAARRMREAGKSEAEVRSMRKDGSIFFTQVLLIRMPEERREHGIHYFFIRDITERKYRETLDVKSEMLSMVAHELRTPLHSVREGISVMLDGITGEINEEQKDALTTAKGSLDRLVRLVNSFLDFQRLEAGIVEFQFSRLCMNDLVRAAQKETQVWVAAKGLDFVLELSDPLPDVYADRDRIMQVLLNLINNAVKFTSHGRVSIGTALREDKVTVTVRDTGIGIKTEDIPKLFRKFGQLESGQIMAPGGTGLGLAISRRIIEEHHGGIWAESEYGTGSAFHFYLPALVADAGL
jgi:PAS domain S-box-containing protein